jgi:DNA-directed RNA polymerase alpha subunit
MQDILRKEFDAWFSIYLYCDYSEQLIYEAWLNGRKSLEETIDKLENENYILKQELASWS